jgi:hypothetical protein
LELQRDQFIREEREDDFNNEKNAIAQSIHQLLPRAFLNSFEILSPNQWQHINWQYEINDQPSNIAERTVCRRVCRACHHVKN